MATNVLESYIAAGKQMSLEGAEMKAFIKERESVERKLEREEKKEGKEHVRAHRLELEKNLTK